MGAGTGIGGLTGEAAGAAGESGWSRGFRRSFGASSLMRTHLNEIRRREN
jgi:hypothetical protein